MFIRAPLSRALWVTKIDLHRGIDRQSFVLGQFHSSIQFNDRRNATGNCPICVLRAVTTLVVSFSCTFTNRVKRD